MGQKIAKFKRKRKERKQSGVLWPDQVQKLQLTVKRPCFNEAEILWTEVPKVTSYHILLTVRFTPSGLESDVWRGIRFSNDITFHDLKASQFYRVRVTALWQGSTVASGKVDFCAAAAPKLQLTVTRPSVTKATIQWTDLPGVTSYKIRQTVRSSSSGVVSEVWSGDQTNNVITFKALRAGCFYRVNIKALCGGTALSSGETQFQTDAAPKLQLTVTRSSATDATIRWTELPGVTSYNIRQTVRSTPSGVESEVWNGTWTENSGVHFNNLRAGCFYRVRVKASGQGSLLANTYIEFRAELTKDELQELLTRATNFAPTRWKPLRVFYRNKLEQHFDDIRVKHGNVMKRTTKDYNGDLGSPINGVLKGLFFSVNVGRHDGQPYRSSPFGSSRLLIPANVMFQNLPNLYFTDFYCLFQAHHVTLVMTKDGSVADKFCREKLVQLDTATNPFVRYVEKHWGPEMKVLCNNLGIEILYTEDVDIGDMLRSHGASFTSAEYNGKRPHGGLPKKKGCTICNLDAN